MSGTQHRQFSGPRAQKVSAQSGWDCPASRWLRLIFVPGLKAPSFQSTTLYHLPQSPSSILCLQFRANRSPGPLSSIPGRSDHQSPLSSALCPSPGQNHWAPKIGGPLGPPGHCLLSSTASRPLSRGQLARQGHTWPLSLTPCYTCSTQGKPTHTVFMHNAKKISPFITACLFPDGKNLLQAILIKPH